MGSNVPTLPQVEDEIEELLLVLSDKRCQRNKLAPISSLPAELLSAIFAIHVRRDTDHHLWLLAGKAHPTITLSHVSHHWRELVLETPLLWSSFAVFGTREYVNTMLARSAQIPLSIGLIYDRAPKNVDGFHNIDGFYSTYSDIFAELPRICRLDIDVRYTRDVVLEELVPGPAPILKSLTLGFVSDWKCAVAEEDQWNLPSLENLRVDMKYDTPDWTSPLLRPSLTALYLLGDYFRAREKAQNERIFASVLGALDSMPLLQVLELDDALPNVSVLDDLDQPHRRPVIMLQNLRTLTLRDDAKSCTRLLQALVFPTSTRIAMETYLNVDDWEALIVAVTKKMTGQTATGPVIPILSAVLKSGAANRILLQCYSAYFHLGSGVDSFALATGDQSPSLTLDIKICGFSRNDCGKEEQLRLMDTILQSACKVLPLHTLQTLYWRPWHRAYEPCTWEWDSRASDTSVPTQTWLDCFARMTELRELYVALWGESSLPAALATQLTSPSGAEQVPSTLLLPALETLCIEHRVVREDGYPCKGLSSALAIRHAAGFPLKQLILSDWFCVKPKHLAPLPALVGEVRWFRTSFLDDEDDEDDSDYVDSNQGYSDSDTNENSEFGVESDVASHDSGIENEEGGDDAEVVNS